MQLEQHCCPCWDQCYQCWRVRWRRNSWQKQRRLRRHQQEGNNKQLLLSVLLPLARIVTSSVEEWQVVPSVENTLVELFTADAGSSRTDDDDDDATACAMSCRN